MDPRRIGSRIKKYAVLHPYVSTLRLAAVFSGEGSELLEALRVIDERPGTPKGAQTVRDIRYDVTLIGPESERFGRAIDQLTLSPGDDRWSRYASAVLDNPEPLLVPAFAYSKRPFEVRDGIHGAWARTRAELEKFGAEGLHVTLIGPMLATSVGVAPAPADTGSFRLDGLAARPVVRAIHALESAPFEGNWLLSLGIPGDRATISLRAAAIVSSAVDVAHGVVDAKQQVGLEVALSGSISAGLRTAHDVSDWVIVADPLFSIELLDKAHRPGDETLLLDFTPEFDPYPGGRVVVSTRYLREIDALGDAVASALSSNGVWTSVLESISARLLLALANPTKQVVHGLAGLALSRVQVALAHPRSLVVPIDGHEDMFVFPQAGHGNILADLLAVRFDGDQLVLQVVESKWTTKANLSSQVDHGVLQATTTSEAIRASYLEYPGVDRRLRFDNLREIILFHVARADRHDIHPEFSADELRRLSTSDELLASARVESTVLVWRPDGSFGSSASEQRGETTIRYFDASGIDAHERAASGWPTVGEPPPAEGGDGGAAAISELIIETLADDLEERQARESADTAPHTALLELIPVHDQASGEVRMIPVAKVTAASSGENDPTMCVRLGSVAHGKADALWCPPLLSNGHLTIIGGSGAGKTTALRHISAEIIGHGVPVLIIDFHGDIDVPGDRVTTHEFDYSGNATFVNPFHLDPVYGSRLGPSRLKWEFLEAWKSVYPTMGVHQTNFLANLIEEAYAGAGISEDPGSWNRTVTFGDVLDRFDSSDVPDAMRAKIESYMKRFLEWRIFHGGQAISVESFLERPTRLDLSQLDESARNILADVVLRRLFLLVRALGPLGPSVTGWSKFRAYVVIDEAQVLMGSSSDAKASLTKYAAEARKFGIGLILATQLRDNVPNEIWGNIDTRLFMQALDQTERARNAKAANVPESMLRSLARGEAILLSSSQPNAAPVVVSIEPSWLR